MTTINITEQTTTVTTVDEVTTITLANAGVQGASYNQGDPIYVVVRNATGSTLNKGDIVYTSGGNGVHTQVSKALATSDATSARVLGWIAETIANNASGLCQVEGYLDGINTQGIAEGTQLYLSGTTAGGFQTTKPQAPIHLVYVGVAVKASTGNGRVYVKVQNGYELDELHDVAITSPTNNQVLTYETSSGLWKNKDNTADGVQSVVFSSPLTGGTVTTAGTVGLDQTALTITQSQVTGLGTALAGKANLAGGNTFTDAQIINANNDATIALQVRRNSATATANIQQWTTSTGTALSTVDVLGYGNFARLSAGSPTDLGYGILSINTGGTATVGAVIRGVAGQSANLLEIQNSGGTALMHVSPTGIININNASLRINTQNTGFNARINVSTDGTAVIGAVVRGASGQSANLQEWQDSAGTVLASISSGGLFNNSTTGIITKYARLNASYLGTLSLQAESSSTIGAVIRGAASQSANLQEWQTSSGSTALSVNSAGLINATRAVTVTQINTGEYYLRLAGIASQTGDFFQVNDTSANPLFRIASTGAVTAGGTARLGQVTVLPASTATVGVVIQGLSGQSANLQEWQSNTGIVARVNASGAVLAQSVVTTNFRTQLTEENSGGRVTITRATAAASNPGANSAALYFRDGTTAGTLKLVVRAGAAGAETTILDNIPQ